MNKPAQTQEMADYFLQLLQQSLPQDVQNICLTRLIIDTTTINNLNNCSHFNNGSLIDLHELIIQANTVDKSIYAQTNVIEQRLSNYSVSGLACAQTTTSLNHLMNNANKRSPSLFIKWQCHVKSPKRSSHKFGNKISLDDEYLKLKQILAFADKNLTVLAPLKWQQKQVRSSTMPETDWQMSVLVLPYANLGSVKHYLKTNRLNRQQKQQLLLAMAKQICALHRSGWLHGDIKSSNFLLLDEQPIQVSLIDFSLAAAFDISMPTKQMAKLQQSHCIQGTPKYVAPECWRGEPKNSLSDIYAFGIMALTILLDSKFFQKTNAASDFKQWQDWTTRHCQQNLPKLPHNLSAYQKWLDKCTAKTPQLRYQSMAQAMAALKKIRVDDAAKNYSSNQSL